MTGVERFDVSPEAVKQIAEQDRRAARANPKLVIALVGPTDLIFGMIRMWQAHVDEANIATSAFRTRDEAELWLNRHRD